MPRANKNHAAKVVGDIFREAGRAFTKLSDMTNLLYSTDAQPGGKWTDSEIHMLRSCVHRFAKDLNRLSKQMKAKTVTGIQTSLKKKSFHGAGIPTAGASSSYQMSSQPIAFNPPIVFNPPIPQTLHDSPPGLPTLGFYGRNSEVTLNMLNATESDVDIDGLTSDCDKLEFDSNDLSL